MNNKIIVLLIIILSSISCTKPSNKIEGAWLAVESRHFDSSSWISPVNGLIFHFSNDSLKYSHVNTDSIKSAYIEYLSNHKLVINYNSGFISDTLKIYQTSKDSITLLFYNTMLVKLVPIDLTYKSELNLQELIGNDWKYILEDDTSKIYFLEENFTRGFNTQKICIAHRNIEIYNLFTYQGSQFIPITFGQTNNLILQIAEVKGDTIFTKYFANNSYKYPLIIKQEAIDSIEVNNVKNRLVGNWKTDKLIRYGRGPEAIEDSIEYRVIGNYFEKIKLLSKKGLIANGLSISFSRNNYQICENNEAIFDYNFRLSNDGSTIILNKGIDPSDYIHIIELKGNELTIGKIDKFSTDLDGEYVEYYYEIRLQKTRHNIL